VRVAANGVEYDGRLGQGHERLLAALTVEEGSAGRDQMQVKKVVAIGLAVGFEEAVSPT
jgi:hypothetical protein